MEQYYLRIILILLYLSAAFPTVSCFIFIRLLDFFSGYSTQLFAGFVFIFIFLCVLIFTPVTNTLIPRLLAIKFLKVQYLFLLIFVSTSYLLASKILNSFFMPTLMILKFISKRRFPSSFGCTLSIIVNVYLTTECFFF